MKFTSQSDIRIVYSPLICSSGISVEGNVPDHQQYDVAANIYTPDYTSTFLVLKPWLNISDPDGILPDGEVTLANPEWWVSENGVEKQITSGTDYQISGTGESRGSLTIKRNIGSSNSLSFRFHGEYVDTRTGQLYEVNLSHIILCDSISTPPSLVLDSPGVIKFSPFRQGGEIRKIKAKLMIGSTEVGSPNVRFVWEKRDYTESGTVDLDWHEVGSDACRDYDVEISADGSEATVTLDYIGHRIDLRCYALYNPYGDASSITISDSTPMQEVSVRRIIGKITGKIKANQQMEGGLKYVFPELEISDEKGIIPNPDAFFTINWKGSTGNKNGTVTPGATIIGSGSKPKLTTAHVAQTFGGKFIAEFEPIAPYAAIIESSGVFYVDSDSKIIISK